MFAQLRWRFATLCVFLTAAAPMAEAQGVASSFEQLRVLVNPGDTVSVADTSGREITGKIADLSSSSLVLLVAGTRRDLPESEVKTIRQRRRDSLKNGALWGFGLGAGFAVIGSVTSGPGGGDYGIIPVVFFGGIGAGAGVAVDAMIASRQVIYAKPANSSARLTVSPLLTSERKGMLVSLGF